jgi:hypothetical protein
MSPLLVRPGGLGAGPHSERPVAATRTSSELGARGLDGRTREQGKLGQLGAHDLPIALAHREPVGLLVCRERDRAQPRHRAGPHRRVEILDGVEAVQLVGEPREHVMRVKRAHRRD